jgi:SAM-dependent methyltransferase
MAAWSISGCPSNPICAPEARGLCIEVIVSASKEWEERESLRFRVYADYAAYVQHQREKLGRIDLSGYSQQFRGAFAARLHDLQFLRAGTTVLCLGARNGVECECFIERGCVAIGVDLNPGTSNRFVVSGDFHNLQYASASFDVVFTNSLDHAFELERVLAEVKRVLKPDGVFLTEIVRGSNDVGGREAGEYESCWWKESALVIDRIVRAGFSELRRDSFEVPWIGDRLVFAPARR